MTHYYEKNIVDIKNEYTEYLITILTPFLYQGFQSMYNTAIKEDQSHTNLAKSNPNIKSLGVLIYFQYYLKDVQKLNANIIEKETKRMRLLSKCPDIFDDLIKSVIKSHIVLLTYTSSGKKCRIVNEKHHQKINTNDFIHGVYIECAKIFYEYPELFWHNVKSNEKKYNQRTIIQLIKSGIINTIRNVLPMKSIIQEYLKNDYMDGLNSNSASNSRYENIKSMIERDANPNYTGYENIMESDGEISNEYMQEQEQTQTQAQDLAQSNRDEIKDNKTQNQGQDQDQDQAPASTQAPNPTQDNKPVQTAKPPITDAKILSVESDHAKIFKAKPEDTAQLVPPPPAAPVPEPNPKKNKSFSDIIKNIKSQP